MKGEETAEEVEEEASEKEEDAAMKGEETAEKVEAVPLAAAQADEEEAAKEDEEGDAADEEYSYSEAESVEGKRADDLIKEDMRNEYAAKDKAYTEISQQHLNDKVNAMDEIGQHELAMSESHQR